MKNTNPQPTKLKDYTPPPFFIESVELQVDLFEDYTTVKSRLKMQANTAHAKPETDLTLVGEALQLEAVILNGELLSEKSYLITPDSLTIHNVPTEFTLDIETRIKPQDNTSLMGLYKSSGNFCTQCEAEGFRHITYFLDRPDVMARFKTTITADQKRYPTLLSNGNPVASGQLDNGRHWVSWEDPFKKPSYLFALVAGHLECVEDTFKTMSGREVKLQIYVEKGNQDQCEHAMLAVKKAMRWDEEKYGREYDLDIYMIVAVSDFNMGAMENKGLNIFNTQYILARPETATDDDFIHVDAVVAHEYFHNWTGNRVTCRDWFQLSLKEGLTVFRDQSFTADHVSKAVTRIQDVNNLRNSQFPEDAGPLAHPVQPDAYLEINNFYTTTIYEKGAEVIRMMQTILGEALFRKGMDLYFERHDGQAVTIEEFVRAMEDASTIDLKQFRLWYHQAGTPVLVVSDHYDAGTQTYQLTIKQICPPTPGQPEKHPQHIPVNVGLLDATGKELAKELLHVKKSQEDFTFTNIATKPIPSLLRNFSAPVILKYDYTDAELQILFKHDPDDFNRWEAGQKYALNVILRLVHDYQMGKVLQSPTEFIDSFQHVLKNNQKDNYLLSMMLALPSEKYIAEQMKVVDVDAIHEVREYLMRAIAEKMQPLLLDLYQKNNDSLDYEFTLPEIGKRQIKNLCLGYLMLLPDVMYHQLATQQFNAALKCNMTDTVAALRTLVHVDTPERTAALAEFYTTWKENALVVDKWFALQAAVKLPTTLSQVKRLLTHEAFDIKNPNKVYSLIGTFCRANIVNFHIKTGEGYQFLADIVLQLNALNPLIAARMVTPLTQWRRFDPERQELMIMQLERIIADKSISKDVYELVSKSLIKNTIKSLE